MRYLKLYFWIALLAIDVAILVGWIALYIVNPLVGMVLAAPAGAAEGEGENQFAVGNKAIMEGIDNPDEIRRLIMERVQRSKLAGLGDEGPSAPASGTWGVEHLRALRQILEEALSR